MKYDDPIVNDPESIPKILYKYRDWENEFHKSALINTEIYFASFDQFNDPYDGNISLRYHKEDITEENVFKKLYTLAKIVHPDWSEKQIHDYCFKIQKRRFFEDENHIRQVNESYYKKRCEDTGIFSLAMEPDNYLMWSHYGNSHKGFCIGYEIAELKNIITDDFGIFSMYYENELPFFDLFEDDMKFTKKTLCSKSEVWKYEREYRIIRFGYSRKTLNISPEVIAEIIFGVKMEHYTKMQILELIREKYQHARVFEAKLNEDFFKLDIDKIV